MYIEVNTKDFKILQFTRDYKKIQSALIALMREI